MEMNDEGEEEGEGKWKDWFGRYRGFEKDYGGIAEEEKCEM
ncbi:glycoside hydrolase family 113, partial [Paenibacillus xylanexedens]